MGSGLWIDFSFGELVCQLFLGECLQTGVGAEQFPDHRAFLHGVEGLGEQLFPCQVGVPAVHVEAQFLQLQGGQFTARCPVQEGSGDVENGNLFHVVPPFCFGTLDVIHT